MLTRVLLVGDAVALRPAQRVAACFGAEVKTLPADTHLTDLAQRFKPHVVIADFATLGDRPRMAVEALGHLPDEPPLILLADALPQELLASLLDAPWFDHLSGPSDPWLMSDLTATLAKLTGQPIFGLSSYLPWGTRIIEVPITGSADKGAVFDRIEAFMAGIGVRGRLVDRLHDVADELLMNAVYDAPVDRLSGAHRYHGLPRTTPVVLAADERPVLRFASDGRRFGVSITDPFGGLSPTTFRHYVAKGLRGGDSQIDQKVGGAGLGLYLLFSSLNSLVLNVHRGRQTEVIGLIDIRGSFRAALAAPKALHVFERR